MPVLDNLDTAPARSPWAESATAGRPVRLGTEGEGKSEVHFPEHLGWLRDGSEPLGVPGHSLAGVGGVRCCRMSLLPSRKLSVEMGVYLTQGDPEQTPVALTYLPVPSSGSPLLCICSGGPLQGASPLSGHKALWSGSQGGLCAGCHSRGLTVGEPPPRPSPTGLSDPPGSLATLVPGGGWRYPCQDSWAVSNLPLPRETSVSALLDDGNLQSN